ncbi:tetratricopeptide repeat protein [Wolbachia endosymbiont (group E) of Neria commutata]|uniref:tetratricopeptide repeat protein n=1 Tax=Wolbachia endosymbiont (group E) of Neria commutata TaxID=3066149 RepID=UPI003132BA75
MLGLNHPDVLVTMSNVGLILNSQGEHQEALGVLNEVYEKRKEVLGQYHPNTLITMSNIASVLEDQYRYQEALKIYKEVCEKVQELFEMDYPLTLLVKKGIVSTLKKQISVGSELKNLGKYQEALKIYEEVYQEQREVLGPDHPDTLLTKNNIAAVLDKQGKYNEALQTYKEVFDIEKVVLGPDHPDTLLTKNNIASLDKKIHSLLANCLTRSRRRRDINNCQFSWEDIDQFNGEDESRNPNKIEIDSEKFIPYIRDIDESKRTQLIQIADQVKVTGKFQGLVNSLISNQKVVNHLSRIQRASSITMDGMMAKNILADFLNDDYGGVAIDIGFVAGGRGFAKVAEAASIKGAGLIADGKLMLGRSFEIGVEVAEVLGLLEGVSSITGPIGEAMVAVLVVGTGVYRAVEEVNKIGEIINLTKKEKFIEGLRAFIVMKPETYIEELMEEKQINDQLVKQGFEYLKQHSDIQKYVFPIGKLVVDSCHNIQHKTIKCITSVSCLIDMPVTYYTEKCTTKFQVDLNNTILLGKEKTYDFFSKAKIANPNEGKILCSPAKPVNLLKFRESVIAGEFFGSDDNKLSLDSLVPEGYERMSQAGYFCHNAIGIATNNSGKYTLIDLGDGDDYAEGSFSQNIFLIGNGPKKIDGGKDDIFIFHGNSTTGYINGGSGSNTIDIGEFALREKAILVDLSRKYIRYLNHSIKIENINRVLARKGKRDEIICACSTEYVDGRGGKNSYRKDMITIPSLDCSYEMQLVVRPHTTIIYNQALEGNFSYIVPLQGGEASVNLPINSQSQHRFTFNYTLFDISNSSFNADAITFNFLPKLPNGKLNITITYNATDNISYRLSDGTEIRIGEKNNLYALQKSNKAINEIINDYPAIANQLKMYIFVQLLINNETAAIGHGNHDVLHNNPYCRSHLVGNGGENIFVITSGYKTLDESKLPIPEVVIYDVDEENKIDTLDLRQVKQQIMKDLGKEVKVKTKIEGKDLLLLIYYDEINQISEILSRTIRYDVICIRLKGTLITNWYERLHVLLDNATMKIEGFDLKPLPLVFAEDKEIIVIKSEDIEKENKLVISRKAGDYSFARSGDDLIITSAFDRNLTNNEFCTICLNNFYQEPKMETLSIKFTDKEILLKDEMDRINNASILTEQLAQYKNDTYNTVFDHGNTISNITDLHQRKHREVKSYENQEFFYARNNFNTGLKEEKVTNSGSRPTSWIGDLVSWVKGKWFSEEASERKELFYAHANIGLKERKQENGPMNNLIAKLYGGLFSSSSQQAISSPISHKEQESKGSASQFSTGACVDVNGTIMLLDVLIRKATGQEFVSSENQPIPLPEAQAYALNIKEEFSKAIVSEADIPADKLIDLAEMQSKVFKVVVSGSGSKVRNILLSYATPIIGQEKAEGLLTTLLYEARPQSYLSNVAIDNPGTKLVGRST